MESRDMSDTESVKGDSSEEELEDLDMEEEKEAIADRAEIPPINNGSSDTRNEVSWPPMDQTPKQEGVPSSNKPLPNLSGTVFMGKDRRERMELEIQNFKGSTVNYSSNPFSKGGFQPGKMRAEQRWKHQEEGSEAKTEPERPKKRVLKNMDAVLTQEPSGGHSSYRMPPGTSRTMKVPEPFNQETLTLEAH